MPHQIPVDAKTGRRASPTDPATWAPFTQAETFAEHRSLDIGFALTIDDCRFRLHELTAELLAGELGTAVAA